MKTKIDVSISQHDIDSLSDIYWWLKGYTTANATGEFHCAHTFALQKAMIVFRGYVSDGVEIE